jgi:PEP-CTERM/exosortase A-associated glycosyltransferase
VRILHVLDHSIPLHSGYTFRTRAILHGQRALGWETVHITGAKQGPISAEVEDVDGLRFSRTQPLAGLAKLPILDQLAVIRGLRTRVEEMIEEYKPDLVHAHSPALNGIAAIGAARRFSLPVTYECRAFWEDAAVDLGTSREWGPRYRLTRALETHVFKRCDAVFAICEGLRADIVERGIAAQKVTVIPNAVDVEHFSFHDTPDQRLRHELKLGDGPLLGFIGSFYAYEGLDVLIDALPFLREHVPDLRVLLVGGGNEAEAIKSQAQRLGVEDMVVFTGRVPHNEVQRYYSLVDLFVYPRKSMRLTNLVTPLKPLEAMAQGKLVIASDVGGHRELIDDGRTGYLFKADDAHALAERVRVALQARGEWESIRQRARRYVESERCWPVSVSNYVSVYERLTASQ